MGMKTKFKHKVEQITEDQLSNERHIELLERKRI